MHFFTDVTVDYFGDTLGECRSLIPRLMPHWQTEDIVGKHLSGGYMNKVIVFHQTGDDVLKEGVVFKIYGNVRDDLASTDGDIPDVISREGELIGMQVGHAAGCFPRLLAVFDNAIVYQYATGRRLQRADMDNPDIVRLVARSAADVHSIDIRNLDLRDKAGRRVVLQQDLRYLPALVQLTAGAPEVLEIPEFQKRYSQLPLHEVKQEIEFIEDFLNDLELPWGYCHNDLHVGNIIYEQSTGQITLIDWELSRYNYTTYDMTTFFGHSQHVGVLDGEAMQDVIPVPVTWPVWQKAYLERRSELQQMTSKGRASSDPEVKRLSYRDLEGKMELKRTSSHDVTTSRMSYREIEGRKLTVGRTQILCDTQMERLNCEFLILRTLHHYYWLAICLFMVASPVVESKEVDMTRFMLPSWDAYQTLKPALKDLKKKHICLTRRLLFKGRLFSHELNV